jgi:hypothetical protein
LACLIKVRENNRTNPNFTNVDKLFQAFVGTVIGNSSVAKSPAQPADNTSTNTGNQNQSQATPVLPLLIQGRRLKAEMTSLSTTAHVRLLVLEATAAGGSSRILHNFWVEVFWRTPAPAFNGGAIVTYFLIDPTSSTVEQSEVLSYMYDYSKFKGMHSASNPSCFWRKDPKDCPKE